MTIKDLLNNQLALLILKIFFMFALGLFVIFAGIVIRQIQLMVRTLNGSLGAWIKSVGWIFLLLTLFAFFLGLIIL
ncbi:hypothetical protein GYA19_02885 [Candidatus Beckwithbacteria bacterium]|nr:hypothetical protein [Candidatus Beckwithbacteria bacterium]